MQVLEELCIAQLNNGNNWTQLNIDTMKTCINTLTINPNNNNMLAATDDGVFISTNNCINWESVNNGLYLTNVQALTFCGNKIFAGVSGLVHSGVFVSTNYGISWTQINSLLNTNIWSFVVKGTNIFAGGKGVFLSTNNGTDWTHVKNDFSGKVYALAVSDNNIFAGLGGFLGAYLSTDNGTSWTEVGGLSLYNISLFSIVTNGTNVIAGSKGYGVFLSKNNGIWRRPLSDFVTPVELSSFNANNHNGVITLNWNTASETNNRGFEIQRKSSTIDFTTIDFVKGKGTTTKLNNYSWFEKPQPGIYSYRLKQFDYNGKFEYSKSVEVIINPNVFTLEQNYPNPFNPSTVISYSLPSASNVKLIVYNSLGQTVKTLENSFKNAGNYSINFKASNLSSGIYFYKLESAQFSQIKKMMLLK